MIATEPACRPMFSSTVLKTRPSTQRSTAYLMISTVQVTSVDPDSKASPLPRLSNPTAERSRLSRPPSHTYAGVLARAVDESSCRCVDNLQGQLSARKCVFSFCLVHATTVGDELALGDGVLCSASVRSLSCSRVPDPTLTEACIGGTLDGKDKPRGLRISTVLITMDECRLLEVNEETAFIQSVTAAAPTADESRNRGPAHHTCLFCLLVPSPSAYLCLDNSLIHS